MYIHNSSIKIQVYVIFNIIGHKYAEIEGFYLLQQRTFIGIIPSIFKEIMQFSQKYALSFF